MSRNRKSPSIPSIILGTAATAALYTVVGWIVYSRFFVNHRRPLPYAIDAKREDFVTEKAGLVSYYTDRRGNGRPLVLIHSLNAAASAYEMRPIFERYRGTRPVYALELPGFGFSGRDDIEYSVELFTDAIKALIQRTGDLAVDVVALSLGCEFAAWTALINPDLIHSLTLISPSGFTRREDKVASQRASEGSASDIALNFFRFPLWSQAFFDLLTIRPGLRFFLKRSFEGEIHNGLLEYGYSTSHQPGARYAPFYFVSGKLFTPNIRDAVYEKLTLPVLVLYDRDGFVRFDTLREVVDLRDNWQAVRIHPTLGLPQFEEMDQVAAALDHFWKEKC